MTNTTYRAGSLRVQKKSIFLPRERNPARKSELTTRVALCIAVSFRSVDVPKMALAAMLSMGDEGTPPSSSVAARVMEIILTKYTKLNESEEGFEHFFSSIGALGMRMSVGSEVITHFYQLRKAIDYTQFRDLSIQ